MNIFDSPSEDDLHNHNDIARPLGTMSDDAPIANQTGIGFVKAVSGIIASFALYLLFFLVLCQRCGRGRGCGCETTTTIARVERSIVKKRALSHEQAHNFEENEILEEPCRSNTSYCSCLRMIKKSKGLTLSNNNETAEDVLMRYKMKNLDPSMRISTQAKNNVDSTNNISNSSEGVRSNSNECNESLTKNTSHSRKSDELTLAEEGILNRNDANNILICPICITEIELGEEVAWSELGHCRHVFHYECILPWCAIGHEQCPVCREKFWQNKSIICKKYYRKIIESFLGVFSRKIGCIESDDSLLYVMRKSKFCFIHGLISPPDNHDVNL